MRDMPMRDMSMGDVPTKRRSGVPVFVQIILIIVVLAMSLVFVPLGAYAAYLRLQAPTLSLPTNATVVTEIQRIGKLETVSYTLQQVITYDPHPDSIWNFLGDPKKVFVVYGKAIAGFDLSRLNSSNVNIQKKDNNVTSITLHMPAPQILHIVIDPTRTKIYDAGSGLFSGLMDQGIDSNATTQILAEAQKQLQHGACQDGILQQASASANAQLTSFLTTVGFSSVTIDIPTGSCS